MSTYNISVGPNATDSYGDYYEHRSYFDGKSWTINERSHSVSGEGQVKSCNAWSYFSIGERLYKDTYTIGKGIIELCDDCLNEASITSVTLPDTLEKIGNHCFKKSHIESIVLPDNLVEIGEDNFPDSLKSINIPPLITSFPVSNLDCNNLKEIKVAEGNKEYRVADNILYNKDLSKIIRCPCSKTGVVIIPNSVKTIGESCFSGCKKLTRIVIPSSVVSIEDKAFMSVKLDNLVIPNTVRHLGERCLAQSSIAKSLKLPANLKDIPDFFLFKATYPSSISLGNYETIGVNAFDETSVPTSLPDVVDMPMLRSIGEEAFAQATKEYLLYSCLDNIGNAAFVGTEKDLIIRLFSVAPVKVNGNAFEGISPDATLIVPEHTKVVFENSYPWYTFQNIVELPIQNVSVDDDDVVSDKECAKRLHSIYLSIQNVNRSYVKETLESLKDNYKYVSSDDEYEEALEFISYNYQFSPAIIPNLEIQICQDWDYQFKLKLLDYAIRENHLYILHDDNNKEIAYQERLSLTDSIIPEVQTNLPNLKDIIIEVHFSNILTFLQNEIELAQSNIKVAVSWFTNYALFKQIKQKAEEGVKVQIITNNDLINNGGYCLDLNALIGVGVEISLVEYPHLLHDKFCIIDDNVVVNGSYNWTRFSGNNYENIEIHRNDSELTTSFLEEFDRLLSKAEYRSVDKMPDAVPERPEYDRSAFRQYITEELDAEARETSDEREKITAIHKAAKLNPKYLEKINPKAKDSYSEAFAVVENSEKMSDEIVKMATANTNPRKQTAPEYSSSKSQKGVSQSSIPSVSQAKLTTTEKEEVINKVKASNLFMAVDVSGSMDDTFAQGHVHKIVTKALEAALNMSTKGVVSVWTFGNDSNFKFNVGLNNIAKIKDIKCMNEGTSLIKFVDKALPSMEHGTLVIILTDDDAVSIAQAVPKMQSRSDIFWQIIVYGGHDNLSNAVDNVSNVSVVGMNDYASMSDS